MFHGLSIRTRLSGWYLVSVTLIVVGMSVASWWAMRASLYSMIDLELQRRTSNSRIGLLNEDAVGADNRLKQCVHVAPGIGLSRIYAADGTLLCESADLTAMGLRIPPPAVKSEKLFFRNIESANGNIRLGARLVTLNHVGWIVEWGEPLALTEQSLATFRRLLLICSPLLIGIGLLVSYAISGRALAPVDTIIGDARSIHSANLSERLSVPAAHDELRRLSETLNSMLDRIEASVRSVQQFTADASHELRSPITVIRAATGYCLGRERSPEEMREAMQRIDREAIHTAQLLDDLLLLARFDANTEQKAVNSADLADCAREALARIAPLAQNKSIALQAQVPQGPIWIQEGLDPVERLIFLLLDNAVKYTPAEGLVRLTVAVEQNTARIEVADTGQGIAVEDLTRVFDRFWRADKVRTRQVGGSGLGLSIAQTIVRQCDGSIRVESKLGEGTSFLVSIPLLEAAELPRAE